MDTPTAYILNWIRVSLSLIYLKRGMCFFIDNKVVEFHNELDGLMSELLSQQRFLTCGSCSNENVQSSGKNTWTVKCGSNVCNIWMKQILRYHAGGGRPNIDCTYTRPQLWPILPWEVAKVYLPLGNGNVTDAKDADISSLLKLLMSCIFMHQFITDLGLVHEVLEIRNGLIQPNDMAVSDDRLQQFTGKMIKLLNSLKHLSEEETDIIKTTIDNIRELQQSNATFEELIEDSGIIMRPTNKYVDVKGFFRVPEEPLSTDINDFPVDVIEGGAHLVRRVANDYQERLVMGCQISSDYGIGTLGAFIDHPSYGLCCITSGTLFCPPHVKQLTDDTIFNNNEKVYQPRNSPMHKFGNVKQIVYRSGNDQVAGVNIALISITNHSRAPRSGHFPIDNKRNTGFDVNRSMQYTSGKVLERNVVSDLFTNSSIVAVKFGCVTGLTVGVFKKEVSCKNGHFGKQDNRTFTLFNQLEVADIEGSTFAGPGDSGALVFAALGGSFSNLQAVGILHGITDNGTYVVTPIWDALEALHLPFQFKVFNNDNIK